MASQSLRGLVGCREERGRAIDARSRRIIIGLAGSFLGIAVASFSSAQGPEPAGLIRVVNLSPDSGAIDLIVNGSVFAAGLPYLQATAHLPAPAVELQLSVVQAGTSDPVLVEINTRVPPGFHKTVAVLGTLESPVLLALTDDLRGGKGIASEDYQVKTIMAVPDIDYDEFVVSVGTTEADCSEDWFYGGMPHQLWPEYGLGDRIDEQIAQYMPGPGPKQSHVFCVGDQFLVTLPDGEYEGAPFEFGKIYTQFVVGTVAKGDVTVLRLVDWEPSD